MFGAPITNLLLHPRNTATILFSFSLSLSSRLVLLGHFQTIYTICLFFFLMLSDILLPSFDLSEIIGCIAHAGYFRTCNVLALELRS